MKTSIFVIAGLCILVSLLVLIGMSSLQSSDAQLSFTPTIPITINEISIQKIDLNGLPSLEVSAAITNVSDETIFIKKINVYDRQNKENFSIYVIKFLSAGKSLTINELLQENNDFTDSAIFSVDVQSLHADTLYKVFAPRVILVQ